MDTNIFDPFLLLFDSGTMLSLSIHYIKKTLIYYHLKIGLILITNIKLTIHFNYFHLISPHMYVYICLSLIGNIFMECLKLMLDNDISGGI